MPNRILKESIKRSPEIDKLKPFEEITFYRIIVTADDFGRLDGRTVVLKNDLYPTKEDVTKKSIEDAITRLASVGLVRRYEVDGNPYLYLPTWELHQRVRNKTSRYPEPPFDTCPQSAADCGEAPQIDCLNPIQKESNPNPNPESNPKRAGAREDVRYADDPALDAAIRDFVADRKARKAPMTDKAIALLVKKLDALAGDDATKIAILEQSIANGWKGIFPLKTDYATQQHSGPKTPSEIANDLMRLYVDEDGEGGDPR